LSGCRTSSNLRGGIGRDPQTPENKPNNKLGNFQPADILLATF
jgi:hypothetical protein